MRKILTMIITTLTVASALLFASSAAAYRYPPVFRATFVHSCLAGAPVSNCECEVRYIESHIQLGTYERQILAYENGGPIPQVSRRAAAACGLQVL
jgi:hypothetical protein